MLTRRSLLKLSILTAAAAAGVEASKNSVLAGTPLARFDREDELLAKMTLEEKVGQLVQYAGDFDSCRVKDEHKPLIRQGAIGSIYFVKGAEASNEAQRIAVEESRLKIPLIVGFDVIHGYRTIFPIPLAESCSWDPAAIERSAQIAAREARSAGVHWAFAPMVDIARDPRWGRIAEGAGEDTFLGAKIAAARIRGFQGENVNSNETVAACVKHFAGYGAAEGGRDYNTTEISERTLREVYLPPFKTAIDAGSASIMSSFNDMNGLPSSAHKFLLKTILRDEWKFGGVLLSDYDAIGELVKHGIAENLADAAAESMNLGLDMDMESGAYKKNLAPLVKDKRVDAKLLDESVRRVLRLKNKLGLFENPYADTKREKLTLLSEEHRRHAREMAQKSIVLLKNKNNLLPLAKNVKSIAVIGPLADDKNAPLGCWSCDGKAETVVSVLEGIKPKITPLTKISYAKGCEVEGDAAADFSDAVAKAKDSELVILVVGESAKMSGEAASRAFLDLPGRQKDLVREIHQTGKPIVLVLMTGRPLAIDWEAENLPAILETWHLGVECGNAVADVLFGDYNPSGKLTTSFPRSVGQLPVYYNHKNTGRPAQSKYLDLPQSPLFPFGYGLSYTTFKYGNLQIDMARVALKENLNISVNVENTGRLAGDEIVQLYIHDEVASVTRPVRELKAFERISLAPGQIKTVKFTISPKDLGFYNREMQYVTEPGTFKIWVGKDSTADLEGKFEVV